MKKKSKKKKPIEWEMSMSFTIKEEGDKLFCECEEDGKLVDRCLLMDTSKKSSIRKKTGLKPCRLIKKK